MENNVALTHEQEFANQNDARIAQLKIITERADKFEALKADPLFDELITELYVKDEALNLVALIADPASNSVAQQESIRMRLGGISGLQSFIRQYSQSGLTAKAEIAQLEMINAELANGKSVEDVLAGLQEAQG